MRLNDAIGGDDGDAVPVAIMQFIYLYISTKDVKDEW